MQSEKQKPILGADLNHPGFISNRIMLLNFNYKHSTAIKEGDRVSADCPVCHAKDGYSCINITAEHSSEIVFCGFCDHLFIINW